MRDLSSIMVEFRHNDVGCWYQPTYGDRWESNQFLQRLRGWSGHRSIGELQRIEVHLCGVKKITNKSFVTLHTTEGYQIKVSLGPLRINVLHNGICSQWHPTDDEYRCIMILLRHFAEKVIDVKEKPVAEHHWVQ